MKLTETEKHSAIWKKIEKQLTDRLQILREKNDADADAIETAKLRGQIAQIKECLSWAKPDPIISPD